MILWINGMELMIVNDSGLYILEFSPPGGGGKSKGLEMGKEMKGEKKRKKGNLGKMQLFTVPNHKTQLVKHNLTLFKP